jgi:hypothetical protein
MIAGTIGLFAESVAELNSHSGSVATLDVQDTQTAFGDDPVQTGLAAAEVETRRDHVAISGTDIDVTTEPARERVHTEWVADPAAGVVAAQSLGSGQPPFPWGVFRAAAGTPIATAAIDTTAFADAHDGIDPWFVGRDVAGREDVRMNYHSAATLASHEDEPSIGVGFHLPWQGTTVFGVAYASGYVAVFEGATGPIQFCRFLRDAILPYAAVPDDEGGQVTLDETAECDECGRESETVGEGGLCLPCRDAIGDPGATVGGDG